MDKIGKQTINILQKLIGEKGLKNIYIDQIKIKECDHLENIFMSL